MLTEQFVKFDYGASAELFMPKRKGGVRPPLGHRRFARAAEAIALLSRIFPPCTRSERGFRSGDERFNSDEIQSLYESSDYPRRRRKCKSQAARAL